MKVICRKCKEDLEIINDNGFVVKKCKHCRKDYGFIAGMKGLSITGAGVSCTCNNPRLELIVHMNTIPRHVYKYACRNCGNSIEIQ